MGMTAAGRLVVWILVAAVAWRVDDGKLDLPAVLLLFGQVVIVPLGVGLMGGGGPPMANAMHRGGRAGLRLGSVAALAALLVPRGERAAALGEAMGSPVIPLVVMATLHGVFAAIGVVFCGLLGWRLAGG